MEAEEATVTAVILVANLTCGTKEERKRRRGRKRLQVINFASTSTTSYSTYFFFFEKKTSRVSDDGDKSWWQVLLLMSLLLLPSHAMGELGSKRIFTEIVDFNSLLPWTKISRMQLSFSPTLPEKMGLKSWRWQKFNGPCEEKMAKYVDGSTANLGPSFPQQKMLLFLLSWAKEEATF